MKYEYDVFLSYSNDDFTRNWVDKNFFPLFKSYLSNHLPNGKAVIYNFPISTKAGESFPNKIRSALAKSKCLVAILNTSYFNKRWCLEELSVFLYREKKYGFRTNLNPSGLIFPVKLFDGKYYHECVREFEYFDCTKYALDCEGFRKTKLYASFQKELLRWVQEIEQIIGHTPPLPDCNPKWLNDEWLIKPYKKYFDTLSQEKFEQPSMA